MITPYMQLCIVIEQLDRPQDALKIYDQAMTFFTDASLINIEVNLYPNLQRSQNKGSLIVQLAAHFKKLLSKAKSIALLVGD